MHDIKHDQGRAIFSKSTNLIDHTTGINVNLQYTCMVGARQAFFQNL